jgi:galactokinase
MKNRLESAFLTYFNRKDGQSFFSPGRVNLIGEHIDYNGGSVFPCALSYGTYGIAALRADDMVCVYSKSFSKEVDCFSMKDLVKENRWSDYIKGSIKALRDHGYQINHGIDLYIEGTMPLGAGLSSSASIEILVIYIFNTFYKLNLSKETMAKLGQYAENKFVLVNSGIMDQFAVVAGRKDHALLLNTHTLEHEYIPFHLGDYQLLIANTNKKRGLADSKYNERYQECQRALHLLKDDYKITYLCQLDPQQLDHIENKLNPTLFKRVKHVVSEQHRTLLTKDALSQGDIKAFADFLCESHQSLKQDYEVTGIELDTLQEALMISGALGARMTGAGFGGCVVAVVHKDQLDQMKASVADIYQKKIGYPPTFYEVQITDGTTIL